MSRFVYLFLAVAVVAVTYAPAQEAEPTGPQAKDSLPVPAKADQPKQADPPKAKDGPKTAGSPKVIEAPREDLNFDIGDYFKIEIATAKKSADFQKTAFIDARGEMRGVVEVRSPNGNLKPVGGQKLYLLDGARVVATALTAKDGKFLFEVKEDGQYQLAGDFDQYLEVAKNNPFQEIAFLQDEPNQPNDPFVPGDQPNPALIEAEAIGSPPNRNASVFLDTDGSFRFLDAKDRKHHASNDEIYLDAKGAFRGVVTMLDEELKRRPLVGANVYLIQHSALVSSVVTRKNGSFAFSDMEPGGYTIVAEYGYHTGNSQVNGNGNAPNDAWERDKAGLPWQQSPGQLAIQRIAVRSADDAIALGPMAEFRKPGNPQVIQVRFQAPAEQLPILHLSPAPWAINVPQVPPATAALQQPPAGSAPSGGGGGGLAGLAGLAALAGGGGGGDPTPPTASPATP